MHGGAAVIIRNDIKHHLHSQISQEHVQATTITIQTNSNYFQMSAVYVPPRHKITLQNWEQYFQSLGEKYIAATDFNAKHMLWAQKLTHLKVEHKSRTSNFNIFSTGRPTYWPIDLNKSPNLIDFAIIKGLNAKKLKITPRLELSSDHTPTIIEYTSIPILYTKSESLCNKSIKWQTFKELIGSKINCNILLKIPERIEQIVATLTGTIQEAARTTTTLESTSRQTITIPQEILDKIREKKKSESKMVKIQTSRKQKTPKQTCKRNKKQNKRAQQ